LARPTPGKKNRTHNPPAGAAQAPAPSQTSQTSQKTARTGAKEHLRQAWLAAFSELGTVSAACQSVPVSRRTILEWRKTDPSFEEAFAEAEITPIDRIEATGIRIAEKDGDPTLIKFFLERRKREVYGKQLDAGVTEAIAKHLAARVVERLNTLIPAHCPGCKTDLRLKQKIAEELMGLSERMAA
jgi:hypothetical protein